MHRNADEFAAELKKFSRNKINNEDDIKMIFGVSAENGRMEDFEKTAFTAKYINGLKRVLAAGAGNPEVGNINQIKKELSDNVEKVLVQIKMLLEGGESYEAFQKKYLEIDQESFSRLNSLLDDLESVKMYFNAQKRKLIRKDPD